VAGAFVFLAALASPAGAQSPSLGSSPVPSATTVPAGLLMPAGTQFDDRTTISAQAAAALTTSYAEHDGVQVALASASKAVGYNVMNTTQVRTRTGDAKWQTKTLDTGKAWRRPAGLPSGRGAYPAGVVAGTNGFVAALNQRFWDSANSYQVALTGQIWSSPDGRKWTRYDPRAILGQRVSYLLAPPAVGPDGRFFVTASVGPLDLRGPSKIVVLRSSDGRSWKKAATLDTRWTLEADGLTPTADGSLLLRGTEYACDDTSGFQNSFSVAAQPHLWAGDAQGTHWKELDSTAGGLLAPLHPVPTKASACPADLQGRSDKYIVRGTLYTDIPGVLVAVDGDGLRAAVSRDGQEWHVQDLPGAATENQYGRDIRARTLVPQPDGSLVLLSLEARRVDGAPRQGGYQVMAWQTTDDGVSWRLLPATRPIELSGGTQYLQAVPDGSVLLTDVDSSARATDYQAKDIVRYRLGTSGPFTPWGICVPAPGADCRFVDLNDVAVAGMDLSGIDLAGSSVTGGDWTAVNLTDARLVGAQVDTPLTGSDLSGADLTRASFSDRLAGTTLTGATLTGTTLLLETLAGPARDARTAGVGVLVPTVPPTGLDLRGLDLRGSYFLPEDGETGSLAGIDLAGVKLDRASFSRIDLTGAKLGKAKFQSLTFYGPDTICPDGKHAKEGVYDQTACRMRPPKY